MRLRILALLASMAILGSLAIVNAPTASASELLVALFRGTVTFTGAGLCNQTTLTSQEEINPKQCQLLVDEPFTFGSSGCVAARESSKKGSGVGACAFFGDGTATGWCGLSKGHVTGSANFLGQAYEFDLTWLGPAETDFKQVGSVLVLEGTLLKVSTGQTGPMRVVLQATPTLTTPDGSCHDLFDKEKGFEFYGSAKADVS